MTGSLEQTAVMVNFERARGLPGATHEMPKKGLMPKQSIFPIQSAVAVNQLANPSLASHLLCDGH